MSIMIKLEFNPNQFEMTLPHIQIQQQVRDQQQQLFPLWTWESTLPVQHGQSPMAQIQRDTQGASTGTQTNTPLLEPLRG